MKIIPLTKGYEAIVDDEDFEWLSQWKWSASPKRHTVYARRSKDGVYMHRLILGIKDKSILCDHMNRNGLDNQKANLRACTRSENQINRRRACHHKNRFIGVTFNKRCRKYQVLIYCRNKKHSVGYFDSEEDAAHARDKKAKELHGDFATLNFPL